MTVFILGMIAGAVCFGIGMALAAWSDNRRVRRSMHVQNPYVGGDMGAWVVGGRTPEPHYSDPMDEGFDWEADNDAVEE